MKWFIGLLLIGLLLATSDSFGYKIIGIALFVGLCCLWIGMKCDSTSFLMISKVCAVILIVIIIGLLIMAILKD